jgi:4-aminobutyrate aminotransferase-like enzyme
MLRRGILVGVGESFGNVARFQPPLVITRRQIDLVVTAVSESLQELGNPATRLATV